MKPLPWYDRTGLVSQMTLSALSVTMFAAGYTVATLATADLGAALLGFLATCFGVILTLLTVRRSRQIARLFKVGMVLIIMSAVPAGSAVLSTNMPTIEGTGCEVAAAAGLVDALQNPKVYPEYDHCPSLTGECTIKPIGEETITVGNHGIWSTRLWEEPNPDFVAIVSCTGDWSVSSYHTGGIGVIDASLQVYYPTDTATGSTTHAEGDTCSYVSPTGSCTNDLAGAWSYQEIRSTMPLEDSRTFWMRYCVGLKDVTTVLNEALVGYVWADCMWHRAEVTIPYTQPERAILATFI